MDNDSVSGFLITKDEERMSLFIDTVRQFSKAGIVHAEGVDSTFLVWQDITIDLTCLDGYDK